MMGAGKWPMISMVLENQFKGESGNIYSLELPQNSDGGGGHPGLAAHKSASEALSEFIKTKILEK